MWFTCILYAQVFSLVSVGLLFWLIFEVNRLLLQNPGTAQLIDRKHDIPWTGLDRSLAQTVGQLLPHLSILWPEHLFYSVVSCLLHKRYINFQTIKPSLKQTWGFEFEGERKGREGLKSKPGPSSHTLQLFPGYIFSLSLSDSVHYETSTLCVFRVTYILLFSPFHSAIEV